METSQLPSTEDWRNLTPLQKEQLLERLQTIPTPPRPEIFRPTRFRPGQYIRRRLGWTPWKGTEEAPGQQEILGAYSLALRQQIERKKYEEGKLGLGQLREWRPGTVIKNRIRIEAGHTVGKTKLASGMVNHFFDHFMPAIIYTFAPTWDQIKLLLWKEIAVDREGRGLPGRLLETCELKSQRKDHFATGRATSDTHGQGSEKVQGQHNAHLMFVLDEAEGVADFVYDAIDSMTSGGISIVLMLANPRTRTSRFHKAAAQPNTVSFRMSCIDHPNVRENREVVPGAVRRDYVDSMVVSHCEVVEAHSEDDQTFELPWDPGIILKPDSEFLWRVLGKPPANLSDRCLIPAGRYEAACKREPREDNPQKARLGLDVQRRGTDFGHLYARWNGRALPLASFQTEDTYQYSDRVRTEALAFKDRGVTSLHIRVDAGGGFGSGIVDRLIRDEELLAAFPDFQVFEIHFGGTPVHPEKFYDAITEATADVGETLKTLAVQKAASSLEEDLCEREYEWRNLRGFEVRKLEKKDEFRDRHAGRSPDDGDAFVLACASDFLFSQYPVTVASAAPANGRQKVSAIDLLKRLSRNGDD